MRLIQALALSTPLLVVACGSTTLTRTGATYQPKPDGCSFELVTAMPIEGVTEVGTVDVSPGMWGGNTYTTLSDVRPMLAPHVCKAGGDIAVAQANGLGVYLKATILKRTSAPAAGQTSLTSASAPTGEGCRFDAQCKGDRVCVAGSCVDPQKK